MCLLSQTPYVLSGNPVKIRVMDTLKRLSERFFKDQGWKIAARLDRAALR